jgi:transposase
LAVVDTIDGMKELSLKEFYAQSLALTSPWKVVEVTIDGESKQVRIRVECNRGEVWGDPETNERAEIKDWEERTWRHLDTCQFETIIIAKVPRLLLKSGRTVTARVPWAAPRGRFTLSFEAHVIALLQQCRTVRGAARLARISEDAADGVMRRAVERGLLRRQLQPPTLLGFDEKAIRKGHRYATILTDVENGCVIDLVEDRTKDAALQLLGQLPEGSAGSIQAVAMDMWPAFMGAVEEALPEAAIVFDKFHIKKHLNEAVDKIRRQEHRKLSAAGNLILSGTKYLWLRRHEDLRQRAAAEFRSLLVQDLQTGTAWALKENFDRFWGYTSLAWAIKFLWDWVETARATKLAPLGNVADMIDKHAEGILNYLVHPITNAAAEGINSIIQSLKHAARGLPNFHSFRARVLFFLGKLDLTPA